ncbi:hypothetical protein ACRCRM_24380, partial [Pseudomonas aeruginosa]
MSELGSLPACWFQVFRALGPGASDTTGPGAADWRSAHGSVFVVDTASGRRAPRRKRLDERAKESNLFAGERGGGGPPPPGGGGGGGPGGRGGGGAPAARGGPGAG